MAQEFLVVAQRSDGFWRDFALPPGPSEAWTTSCVGLALGGAEFAAPARRAACDAVRGIGGPQGWGYNRATAADADSTATAIRFLAAEGELHGVDAAELLERYIDRAGCVTTFDSTARFGAWGEAHADVTPTLGLALIAAGSSRKLVGRIRDGCLSSRRGLWQSYWWEGDAYAVARNLEFLRASGGISEEIVASVRSWLEQSPPPRTAFEASQRLHAAAVLGSEGSSLVEPLTRLLLDLQLDDGSWPPSPVLRLPSQDSRPSTQVFADECRVFGTAQAVSAMRLASETKEERWQVR